MNKLLSHKIMNRIAKKSVKSFHDEMSRIGLSNSNLDRTVKYQIQKNTISISFNDYGVYVDEGRKKGEYPPIDELNSWAKKHHMNVYAVAENIYENGIKAKPWMERYEKQLLDIDDETYLIFVGVTKYVDNEFKKMGFKVK